MRIELNKSLAEKINSLNSNSFLREIVTGEKQCAICLGLFKAKQKRSSYCSFKCIKKFHRSKRAETNAKKVSELRQCPNCLGLFKAKIDSTVYCSRKCREILHRSKRNATEPCT